MNKWLSYPNPVNYYAVRMVAVFVLAVSMITIALDVPWLTIVLAVGFLIRMATGPRFEPVAVIVSRGVMPVVGEPENLVPGPPKRFAQAIGFVTSTLAAILAYGFGLVGVAYLLMGVIAFAAALEVFASFCLGTWMFGYLLRWKIIPAKMCPDCLEEQSS